MKSHSACLAAVLICASPVAAARADGDVSLGAILQGYNNWSGRIAHFDSGAEKEHPLIGFSVTWNYEFGVTYPDFVQETLDAGAVPFMTWMSCGDNIWDSGYPLQDIIDGTFDDYIRRSARALKAYGKRILCRFDQEMNLDIWAWSVGAPWNSGDPKQFVAMWRHVVDIFNQEKVNNVEWVWCPNCMSNPYEEWNEARNFYPGDAYLDWIGIDGYSWGSANTSGNLSFSISFPYIYDPIIREFQCRYRKPIILGEIGCLQDARYPKEKWIGDAYDYIFYYPFIKGTVWLNSYNPDTGIQEDFRVVTMYDDAFPVPPAITQAYRDAAADDSFITSLPPLDDATPERAVCDPLPVAGVNPAHEVKLNKRPGSTYRPGDILAPAYFLYPSTDRGTMFVDAYLAFKLPDGSIYSYVPPKFVRGIVPSVPGFAVKRKTRGMAFYFTFPATLPEGDYTAYSALVEKGKDPRLTANQFSFDQESFSYRR